MGGLPGQLAILEIADVLLGNERVKIVVIVAEPGNVVGVLGHPGMSQEGWAGIKRYNLTISFMEY